MPVIYTQACNNTEDKACPKVDQALDAVYWWAQNRIDISRLYHYQEAFSTAFEGEVVPEFRR
jgi:hypothetical protein